MAKTKNRKDGKEVKVDGSTTKRICWLFAQMNGCARKSLEYAIQLGGILEDEKKQLKHGQWEKWGKDNLPFTSRMARKYIKLWNNRKKFISELSSADPDMTLTKALRMLTEPDNAKRDIDRGKTKEWRRKYANMKHEYDNPDGFMDKIIAGDNNIVLPRMIDEGLEGKLTMVVTSPPYDNNREYGPDVDDDLPYDEYLDGLLKRFVYYAKLLRPGGRVVYNIASVVQNKFREEAGQPYSHIVADDLYRRVEELGLGFRRYEKLIWFKRNSYCCDNNKTGTHADPTFPVMRTRHEYILVWAYKQFNLPNINNVKPDITKEEFNEWTTSVWEIPPYIGQGNPNSSAMPEELAMRILKIWSRPLDWVIDPYSGSGTVPKVCKDLGRPFTGIDLQKGQCKYAKARISA